MLKVRLRVIGAVALAPLLASSLFISTAQATTSAPTAGSIHAAQGEVAAVEAKIAAESNQQQVAGEKYDQSTVLLSRAQSKLAAIRKQIALEAKQIHVEKIKVRKTAVDAYVYGQSASADIGTAMSSNVNDLGTASTYSGIATNSLHGQVVKLSVAETEMQKNEAAQQSAVSQAATAVQSQADTKASLDAAANASKDTLSQVKGQLAQLIAQQEAAAAAAAQAAAQAAAASAAAREAAAEQAAQAAAIAQAVATTDPSATTTAAATAATVAAATASSVGQTQVATSGASTAGNTALATAESFLGVPYVWGGASKSGVDCSGLTMLAWESAGVSLAHSAYYQYNETSHLSATQLQPGDLIFYYFPNDGTTDPVSHVVMYVGSGPYGAATILQAPETGRNVSYAPMYYNGLVGYGRP